MIISSDQRQKDLEYINKKSYMHKRKGIKTFAEEKFDRDTTHAKQRANKFYQSQQEAVVAPKKSIPGLAPQKK
jgi:hypothetical protein